MAMTLVDFWNIEVTAYETLSTELQSTVSSAQSKLDSVKAARFAAQAELAKTDSDIAALEAKIASETLPSDIEADSKMLRKLVVQQRSQSGKVSQLVDSELDAQVNLEVARESAAAIGAKLAAAVAGKANADARAATKLAWTNALAAPPLSTLPADANIAKTTGTQQKAAKARIDTDFPTDLQTLATQRHDAQKKRFDGLHASYDTSVALMVTTFPTSGGRDQSIEAARNAYNDAWARLGDWVKLAKSRYDAALGLFVAIAAAPPLSPAEVSDVKSSSYAVAADAAAKGASKDRDDARSTVWIDQIKLEDATIAAYVLDPTATPDLSGPTKIVNDAKAALGPLETAFTTGGPPSPKDKLGLWEAALPDSAYRSLANYELANDLLNTLASATPSALVTKLNDQEDTLATALQAAAKAERSALFLREILKLQSKRVEHVDLVMQDRIFSAVRGDV